ncbi:LOB domain-containing protein 36-like [Vigna umbellata]|uniref:LOB domain-containing protein 36-like n=1 Tax=Vigna umbellata TaxID=87088 RepID=UPI001F5E8287|nr:LOB domain-containing protein 36-like [Vigna umbellata]
MSSLNSPCAACKLLRRKCTQECVFAPYFPPDNPQRFECVHRVFGASNVSKLLNELSVAQRDDAVKSLAYEAEARLRDPVYGCVGIISLLQQRLRQIQMELQSAKKELSTYVSPQTMQILLANPGMVPSADIVVPPSHQPLFNHVGNNMAPQQILVGHGGGQTMVRDPQQQDFQEAQQIALATREQQQQMFRNYEQKVFGGFEPSNGGFGTQGEFYKWYVYEPIWGSYRWDDYEPVWGSYRWYVYEAVWRRYKWYDYEHVWEATGGMIMNLYGEATGGMVMSLYGEATGGMLYMSCDDRITFGYTGVDVADAPDA